MTEAAHLDRMVCESATYLRVGEAAVSDATGPDGPARDAGSRTVHLCLTSMSPVAPSSQGVRLVMTRCTALLCDSLNPSRRWSTKVWGKEYAYYLFASAEVLSKG